MAKSITRKYSEFDLDKIRRFTEQELDRISGGPRDLPFCYQIGFDVLVGHYKVVKIDNRCWRVVNGTTNIFDFFSRKDAIFYCIALHQKEHTLANDIKKADTLLGRLEVDAIQYRSGYKKAVEKGDGFREDYYSARYTDTMDRLEEVKKELKKTLNLAKYIKE
jgi:hypothetical protein